MTLPLHELAALGTATCWATTGLIAAEGIRVLGAFRFNLIRQLFVALLLAAAVTLTDGWSGLTLSQTAILSLSGILGILLGDTLNFAAVARIGPRRTGAIFALNAPMAAILGWAFLGEKLPLQASLGIAVTALGVAVAILGRPRANAHRLEAMNGTLLTGLALGLGAALGQAAGTLIARPVMTTGMDPYLASLFRVGASGALMAVLTATPFAPKPPLPMTRAALGFTLLTAFIGLGLGMTLFLYALKGSQTGIIATLSATSPVIILPLLWLRTGQRPTATSALGGALAVAGLALIFLR
ncbi:DMT family transporter [Neogemmobacter tilapiae]|uniref:Membrane protein n=1 Tax=Neogemmobacter tilapiae TaxID=875041 RepID=A0A918TER1_9RHOB|nr:DMT family transporter [Gemmobacter tilapiae]GHC46060.1 membrane protein [Gemmobacter tilapiae]